MEEWRDIQGYEGYYQVSNWGRVKSLQRTANSISGGRTVRERILKQSLCRGYLFVVLVKPGLKRKMYKIHRLVASNFLDGRNEVVNHIDGDKLNNKLDNLEWCSQSSNEHHAKINKLKYNKRGDDGRFIPRES
jgi:hypothetical protein